ncbi:hypothetical protein [Clostridium estertheticum]|nr:hypothetical protein [Clostridium estertheticum]
MLVKIVVNNGRIEEIGSFDELTQKKGYFFSLYNVTKEDLVKRTK